MEWLTKTWDGAQPVLEYSIFEVSGTKITIGALATGVIVVIVGYILVRLADRSVERALRRRVGAAGELVVIRRLLRYVLWALTGILALDVVGIPIKTFFAAGAIFAVGIGFAMQNIAQNFVSGVILLLERSIKPGDIVYLDGRMLRVDHMGIRSAHARTRDDEELIIPNSNLAQGTVINYVFSDTLLRLRCQVGVAYDSDMARVREVLEETGVEFKAKKPPVVLMREFTDRAVVWELSVWTDRPWEELKIRSEVLEKIWFNFKAAEIVIAFPQLDVHFDTPVEDAWSALAKGRGGDRSVA